MTAVEQVTDDHCEVVLERDGTNEEAWLDARREGVSASDALAAMGFDPRKQRAALWIEKTQGTSVEETEPMVMGRILEPAVKQAFAWKSGLDVVDATELLRSVAWPWMLCTPDGYVKDTSGTLGLFEAKTTTIYLKDDWADGQIPERAAAQTMHGLAVTGLPFAFVAVLINNQVEYRYMERDEALIAEIIRLEQEFWQYVIDREMPPIHPGRDAPDLLHSLYPRANEGTTRELTEAERDIAVRFRRAGSEYKHWERERAALGDQLKILAGDAEFLTWNGDPIVSVKSGETRRIDIDRLRAEQPEIAKQYEKVTLSRRLLSLKRLSEVAA